MVEGSSRACRSGFGAINAPLWESLLGEKGGGPMLGTDGGGLGEGDGRFEIEDVEVWGFA